jgi:hypothetical protein
VGSLDEIGSTHRIDISSVEATGGIEDDENHRYRSSFHLVLICHFLLVLLSTKD